MKKGTMIWFKKGIGAFLLFNIVNYFYPMIQINEYLHLVAMAFASYFLLKSGSNL